MQTNSERPTLNANPTQHHDSTNTFAQDAVVIKGLSHVYGNQQALDNINFNISNGLTVGLIGPDGVGKSTLLAIISGVKIIQQGEVFVHGHGINDKAARQHNLQRIAYMPQGLGKNLYPTLSITENIDFHARLFGLSKKQRVHKMQQLLEATGLAPFADRAAGKLSGGMKQKLSLCCALVHDPDLLMLDEPTTGVDPLSRRQFWELVDSLRSTRQDMTVIVATAYIDEAERFDRILAMNAGQLLISAPTQDVLQQTQSNNLEQAYIKLLPQTDADTKFDFNAIPPFTLNPNQAPVIEANHLSKKFGKFAAVDDVSFKIEQGEIFGFLGSNGCGKSTTMKMLTGLLPPSSGSTKLLGQSINAETIETRMRIGYMSQNFCLYEELTVYQNLNLHARLYRLKSDDISAIIHNSLKEFDLINYAHHKPSDLSLGIRQRLQLAAACLHKPDVLILDEPTSGVDPSARDMFWQHLIKLSRQDRITIFVSTHFMNEASWCDRISLMHQGKVLAMGTPQEIITSKNSANLEQAFIAFLEDNAQRNEVNNPSTKNLATSNSAASSMPSQSTQAIQPGSTWSNIWTFMLRESKELMRDPVRLLFAFFGPICLLLTSAWGISLDIKNINTVILDRDQSQISHELVNSFVKTNYFNLYKTVSSTTELDKAMRSGEVKLAIDIPADFGKQLLQQQKPEVGFYIDGSIPFIAENVKGFILDMSGYFSKTIAKENGQQVAADRLLEPRFIYDQEFNSINAMTPSMIMMAMMLFPVIMTALGVVREREIGSITNLYSSPATVVQFLVGKQLSYIVVSSLSFLLLVWAAIVIVGVPVKGSFIGLFIGALCLLCAATALGLLISCFVKSQVAAIFGSAILSLVPALNFSGIFAPISSLNQVNQVISYLFPAYWFKRIMTGGFIKELHWSDFYTMYLALLAFAVFYVILAGLFLKKQEP